VTEVAVIRRVVSGCLLLSGLLTVCGVARAGDDLEVLDAQGNVFVLFGPYGNTTVQIGPEGPLIVDTQPAALSEPVLAAIRRLTPRPIRHIVLTNGSDQSAGGAAKLAKAGRYVRLIDSIDPRGLDTRASIMAHINVLNRMSAAKAPSDSWPTDTYFVSKWSIFSNGEAVQLLHVPAAQTDGDTIVFFRRSDVISTGAVFDASAYPRFDVNQGGSVDGLISALNDVVEIAIAGENQEGGTVIVPGRGRLADQTDVANYRDMVTIVRDRVRDLIGKGLSLDQVKQANPTLDYDGLYDTLDWTHDMFVEAVYRDLSRARP
jgi:glyoxylase-like metal-dependent hydrolase (beta-lactamase superfamily II)